MKPERRHEIFDLKSLLGHHLVSATVGAISLGIAMFAPLGFAPLPPTSLVLMGPGHFTWGTLHGRQRAALPPPALV